MSKLFRHIIFGFSFILLYSCGNQSFYDHNEEVTEPWKYSDIIDFEVDVTDTINPFNFYINIRNTTDYNYSNIYLFVKTVFPDGRFSIDTAEIFLADLHGNWLGSGFGKNKDLQVLFRKRGRFPMSGVYHFRFEQAMRELDLDGIKAVGIRIERTE